MRERLKPHAPALAQATGAVAGLLLLVATTVPWAERGAGSSLALIEVADLVLSGTVASWVPRPLGLLVYAIPLGGALLLIGAGLGGRRGVAASGVGALLALVGTVVAISAVDRLGTPRLGLGLASAGVGVVLALASVGLGAASARARPGG